MIAAIEEAPSLGAMMLTAWLLARLLAVKLVEEELAERAQRPTKWPNCEKCGKKLESKGFVKRTLRGLIGTVRWERRVGRCPDRCEIGQVAPLDTELGLRPNQRVSDALKRAACALAVFVPFGEARELLALLTGVVVNSGSIWNWVQEVGRKAKARLERQLKALLIGELPEVEEIETEVAELPLLIGADGVMVPFRPDGGQPKGRTVWREVKVGILARLGRRVTKAGKPVTQLVRRRLVAVRGDIDALQPRLWIESVRQGILTTKTVVWLSDGGRGFWRLFRDQFEVHAQGILDFYHAAQNLWQGAKAWLDGRTQRARQWFVLARRKLRRGKADEVLADIKAALALEGLPDSARKTLTNLYNYLDMHRDHINTLVDQRISRIRFLGAVAPAEAKRHSSFNIGVDRDSTQVERISECKRPAEREGGYKAELVRLGHAASRDTHHVPGIRGLTEKVGKVTAHLPATGVLKDHIRVFSRQFERRVLVIKGGGDDHPRAFGDHVLHCGRCTGLLGDILSLDDLNAFDVLGDGSYGLMHCLVVAGVVDRTTMKCSDDQAGTLFNWFHGFRWLLYRWFLNHGVGLGRSFGGCFRWSACSEQ